MNSAVMGGRRVANGGDGRLEVSVVSERCAWPRPDCRATHEDTSVQAKRTKGLRSQQRRRLTCSTRASLDSFTSSKSAPPKGLPRRPLLGPALLSQRHLPLCRLGLDVQWPPTLAHPQRANMLTGPSFAVYSIPPHLADHARIPCRWGCPCASLPIRCSLPHHKLSHSNLHPLGTAKKTWPSPAPYLFY